MKAGVALCGAVVLVAAQASLLFAQDRAPAPLSLLDVPFVSQSEALCGGAAAAMVLRYWGERGVSAESFSHLIDRSAAGIRTNTLINDIRSRGWNAVAAEGNEDAARRELAGGRPIVALIEDRPGTFHYVVLVAWHERGVIFHDPARAPFRVMTTADFHRRWEATDRWMAVIAPRVSTQPATSASPPSARLDPPAGECDQVIAEGVKAAQANQLDAAERILTSALSCPGGAAARELGGVRVLQRRWGDAADLAQAALADAPQDAYAWRLLATARFVQEDRAGALEAWNQVGEPTVDLIVLDGLRRTRHAAVERMLSVRTGQTLTSGAFARAQRQLSELPAATATRLDYVPVRAGLAELRGAVVERALFPARPAVWVGIGLSAAVSREVRVTTGSLSGGGERVSAAWRFWPGRQRIAVGVHAPAPWGGVWGVAAAGERQPFTQAVPAARRVSARVTTADWASGRLRWDVAVGMDRWRGTSVYGVAEGGVRLRSLDERVDARIGASSWIGGDRFATTLARIRLQSSTVRRGFVAQAAAGTEWASSVVPLDLWAAGDTGHVRDMLMRAHPVLEDGGLRVDRVGRVVVTGSVEGQHWWPVRSLAALAAAVFVDAGRTALRLEGRARNDLDVGIGARFAIPVVPGIFRVDLAKGLADGATALSFVYQP